MESDLHQFRNKTEPGSVKNKWALLYLLKTISHDTATISMASRLAEKIVKIVKRMGMWVMGEGEGEDSENLRDLAYREYGVIVKEENNVTEEVLVRGVLFDESVDGYILPDDSIKVGKSVRLMVRKLCELGWLFRKVKGYVDESVERFCDKDVGTVGQAFCAALQDELGEYYKLL